MKYRYLWSDFFIRLIFFFFILTSTLQSQDPEQSIINVNNITSWVRNDGFHDWVVASSWNGVFPKSIPAGAIFSEGLVWGGKIFDGSDPLIRVNGSDYGNGNLPITRLFRVRTYYQNADLTDDAANFFLVSPNHVNDSMIAQIYQQYKKDWNEWPGEKGAPFYDTNKNGIYEPDIDVPGIPGASQTIWINYNDEESYQTYGSPPIGLEIQETYWAYASNYMNVYDLGNMLTNVIYKHARIIYKGTDLTNPDAHIDSMFFVQWVDTNLGSAIDDFAGCDTSLNLGYVYNSRDTDAIYSQFLKAPPAIGHVFLQGVADKTNNFSDSAIVNFKWQHGYKFFHPQPLTVFIASRTGDTWGSPPYSYEGALQYYNLMRGYSPSPPYPSSQTLIFPLGKQFGGFGTYNLDGDPVTGTGWIEGIYDVAGSRSIWMMNGPFNLNIGDAAEVVEALVGGIGSDRLNSITTLRLNVKRAIIGYENFVYQMTADKIEITPFPNPELSPENYVLYQNYPNPFNSSTIIKYDLPKPAYVRLIIYDVLGREIRTLVNEEKDAGRYEAEFSGEGLPSGVYFCKISFENSFSKLVNDNLTKTNKLILIK